jgi:conjugative relaxase-like TrwC/TraI family protein
VLRFATFGSAAAAVRYYVRDGADCARAVGYYSESGRVVGRWAGRGAAALGLSGPITDTDERLLAGLLSGALPDGQPVAGPVWRPDPAGRLPVAPLLAAVRTAAADRGVIVEEFLGDPALARFAELAGRVDADPRTAVSANKLGGLAAAAGVDPADVYGERWGDAVAAAGRKVNVRRAGVDGPVSAPKSVSVLWALADPATREQVLAAHRRAVDEAVAYLERTAGHALRGHQGDGQRAEKVSTDGLIVAAFDHHTSRADDPQLHTHLVITNLLHGVDGRWSALDTRALFRAQRTAGYLYQATLRGELTTRLGVRWSRVEKGVAEIDGIPASLRRVFSTRRQAIEARLAAIGRAGTRAAQVACLDTRPAKTGRNVEQLGADWRARAEAHQPDIRRVVRSVLARTGPLPALSTLDAGRIAATLLGPDGVTATRTGFDRAELTRALLEQLPAGTPVGCAEVETLVDRLLADPQVLTLIPEPDGRRFTTVELARTETATLRLAEAATWIPTSSLDPLVAVAHGLSREQHDALAAVVSSDRSVDVLLGPAGSGKTALLAALHTHYHRAGVPVLGVCVAAVTARRLQIATAITASSATRLLAALEGKRVLPERCVLVVDEAGMLGTRDYHQLLSSVTAVGGKLVAVGDPAQLGEIAAGGMFTRLATRNTRAELAGNQRQVNAWERAALTQLRAGQVEPALAAYEKHGRIHTHDSPGHLRERIATDYLNALESGTDAFEVIALATTRTDTDALNHTVRTTLQAAGRVGPDQPCADRVFAVGELVIVGRNDYPRDLHNGTRAQITTITPGQVQLRLDDRRAVTVPTSWAAERLRPAYALTIHKAQGITVDTALVDATGISDRNAGYVALSRARTTTQIHQITDTTLSDTFNGDTEMPSLTDRGSRAHTEHVAPEISLATRLRRERLQRLALEQLGRTQPADAYGDDRLYDPHYRHQPQPSRDYGLSR